MKTDRQGNSKTVRIVNRGRTSRKIRRGLLWTALTLAGGSGSLHAQEAASPAVTDGAPTSRAGSGKPSSAKPGFWVVVRAQNKPDIDRLGGAVHQVKEAELRALDYADPDRAMARIPGVYVRSEDGFGLRPNIGMRGANSHRSRRITILEDGVLQAYAPYASPSIFSLLPITRVVGVDVYRGPSAILFGPQTIGGAIDFRTRDVPQGTAATIDYSFGVNNWQRTHFFVGASNATVGVLLEGLYAHSDGFQKIDATGGSNGFDLGDIALRAFHRHTTTGGLRHRLSTKFVYQMERSNETYLGLTDADYAAAPYRRYVASAMDEFKRSRTQVELREQLDYGGVHFTVVGYQSYVKRVWYRLDRFRKGPSMNDVLMNPDSEKNSPYYALLRGAAETPDADHALIYVNNDWRYLSQGIQADGRYHKLHGRFSHELRAGLRIHQDSIDRHIGADGWLVRGTHLVPDGTGRMVQNEDLASTMAFSTYAHYALGIGPLTLSPGARVEWLSMRFVDRLKKTEQQTSQAVFLPGGAILLDPTDSVRLFAGVHRGFTPPLPQDAATTAAETSTNYELGGRYVSAAGARIELTGFFSDYDNMTSQCTLTAGCTDIDRSFNSGRVFVWGIESAAGHALHTGAITIPLQLAYTYTGSSFRSSFSSADPQLNMVRAGDELPYVPAHQVSLSAGVTWRQTAGLTLQGMFIDGMREEASQGDAGRRTDRQWLLDAMAFVRVMKHVTLYARGENLLLHAPIVSRRPWGARPGRPFQAQLGVRIEL